jgi:hypothetical protein
VLMARTWDLGFSVVFGEVTMQLGFMHQRPSACF